MYTDWKKFFTQYIPHEDYIPDGISSKNLSSFTLFVVLGFITALGLITKVESKSFDHKVNDPTYAKIDKIKTDINQTESKNALIESEVLILNHKLTKILENKEKKEIQKLSKLTGTNKKVGAGIVIQLSDSDTPLKPGENPNFGVVHNTDLLSVINNLWAAKAEAIAVNNQRITSMTEINCIGPTILVNKTRIVPPFIIKAIGDPDKLSENIKKGSIKNLEAFGIKYILNKYNQIEIPADSTIILAGDF